ncbi:MAG: hypothetical protein ACLR0U_11245 [Enterocloster clostridioformis]
MAGCADIALYEAKETRKGQTVEYKDEAAAAFCILSACSPTDRMTLL